MSNYNYNSSREDIILREYGRNIQKIVNYIKTIEDQDKRTKYAHSLIQLMKEINPNTRDANARDAQDYQKKLWDDLYIMSKFSLEVDSPFPMPEKSILGKKPKPLSYSSNRLRFKHYGRNIELLILTALKEEEIEQQTNAFIHIAMLMQTFYSSSNKDNLQNEIIVEHIEKMAGQKLKDEVKEVLLSANLFGESNNNHKNNNYKRKRRRRKK